MQRTTVTAAANPDYIWITLCSVSFVPVKPPVWPQGSDAPPTFWSAFLAIVIGAPPGPADKDKDSCRSCFKENLFWLYLVIYLNSTHRAFSFAVFLLCFCI